MSDPFVDAGLSLIEALAKFRIASEDSDATEDTAALIAVGHILTVFPGSTLLREVIETSFPRAARPAADDNAALSKMAELVANGQGLKPASREVVRLAAPGNSDDAIAQRLRRKFRSSGIRYLGSDQSRLIIEESRRLITDLIKRKAEHVDRPYGEMVRRLERARRDLELKIADWEERQGMKVSGVKNPDSRRKM
jgi:hypothetical protein